jgi:hypothetical protein
MGEVIQMQWWSSISTSLVTTVGILNDYTQLHESENARSLSKVNS